MNIAFPFIALLILILPGILFNYFLRRGLSWTSPVRMGDFAQEVTWGVFTALFIHAGGIVIIGWITDCTVSFEMLTALLLGKENYRIEVLTLSNFTVVSKLKQMDTMLAFANISSSVLGYFITTNILSIFVSIGVHSLIRAKQWDLSIPFLRFENQWKYLFDGGIRLIAEKDKARGKNKVSRKKWILKLKNLIKIKQLDSDFTYVRAVVEEPGRLVEYAGTLVSYSFGQSKEIEHIVLCEARYCILHEETISNSRKLSHQRSRRQQTSLKNTEVSHATLYDDVQKIRTISDFVSLPYKNIRSIGILHEPGVSIKPGLNTRMEHLPVQPSQRIENQRIDSNRVRAIRRSLQEGKRRMKRLKQSIDKFRESIDGADNE